MDNTVTQEVFKRVDALAEKLGTTAGYMWPKLVNYTAWRAGADIMAGFILVIVFAYATTRLYKYWKKELDIINSKNLKLERFQRNGELLN